MRKTVILLLVTMLSIFLIACSKDETEAPDIRDITAVESFGNHVNQQVNINNYIVAGDWLYGDDEKHLLKRQLSTESEPEIMITIYGYGEPTAVTAYDGWIYYGIIGGDDEDDMKVDLYRIREDGSGKTKLADGGDDSRDYVLLKEGIVFLKNGSIFIMNLDGTNQRLIPIGVEEAGMAGNLGVDNGWIYYWGFEDIYRMKSDGTKTEKVRSCSYVYSYVADKNELYLVQNTKKTNIEKLIKKTINGKETILATASFGGFDCLNVEGDWLYYEDNKENKVYKMKKSGKEAKQLVYKCVENEQIEKILLYDGDVLISTTSKDVYVKKDGTVINIYPDAVNPISGQRPMVH